MPSAEGGEDLDGVLVALQEHFRHPGHGAEVAVDLERRVHGPEVGGGAFADDER